MAPRLYSVIARSTLPGTLENNHLISTRAGYNAVSVVCLIAGITMATIRIRQFVKAGIINPSRVTASATYFVVVLFLVLLNMFSGGVGIQDVGICSALIYVCLGMSILVIAAITSYIC
jgi:hypothetical protein